MPDSPRQRKSRADAKLDASVVANLAFFHEQNGTKKHKAAILLAEDDMPDVEIAKTLRIGRTTLHTWKQDSAFQQVIEHYRAEILADAMRLPIAKKTERVRGLNALNDTYWEIKHARAERHRAEREDTPEAAMRQVFGDVTPAEAETGMFVRQPKIAANGTIVVEWAFDKALDSAIKETYREAAAELGQRTEKHEVDQHGAVTVEIVGVDTDKL